MSDDLKMQAARAAIDEVHDGMVLGIGTGSTAEAFVRILGERVADGLIVTGVATSERTEQLCRDHEIQVSDLDEYPVLDLTIDGADEIDGHLNLVKGGGGALLREKIVAAASRRMVVIADGSKLVETLGAFPLPIEVMAFGVEPTRFRVAEICREHGMAGELVLRTETDGDDLGAPVRTDGDHLILDAGFGAIENPEALARELVQVPGVVEHGLFLGLADLAIVAEKAGVRRIERPQA